MKILSKIVCLISTLFFYVLGVLTFVGKYQPDLQTVATIGFFVAAIANFNLLRYFEDQN